MKSRFVLTDGYKTYYTKRKLITVRVEDDPRYIKTTYITHYERDTKKYIVDEAGRTKTGHFLQIKNPNFRCIHDVIEVRWQRV